MKLMEAHPRALEKQKKQNKNEQKKSPNILDKGLTTFKKNQKANKKNHPKQNNKSIP